jgi:putative transposase
MAEYIDIRTGRHCVFLLHAHLVYVTKFPAQDLHRPPFDPVSRSSGTCAQTSKPNRPNSTARTIHLLVNFPPKIALSKLVNSLKGVAPRKMRQEFPEPARHYYRAHKLWSGSYLAGSVGGAVDRAPLHRTAKPARQEHARALEGAPARAITPSLKAGALARIPVARTRRLEKPPPDHPQVSPVPERHAVGAS